MKGKLCERKHQSRLSGGSESITDYEFEWQFNQWVNSSRSLGLFTEGVIIEMLHKRINILSVTRFGNTHHMFLMINLEQQKNFLYDNHIEPHRGTSVNEDYSNVSLLFDHVVIFVVQFAILCF